MPLSLHRSDRKDREIANLIRDYRGQPFASAGKAATELPSTFVDISQDVFAVNVQKQLSITTPGRFTLSLVEAYRFGLNWSRSDSKVSYTVNIQPNDLILIQLNAGDQDSRLEPVMFGIVTRIAKETQVSGDRVSHYVSIQGADLTHWLLVHRNFFWLYAVEGEKTTPQGINELRRELNSEFNFIKNILPSTEMVPADRLIDKILKERALSLTEEERDTAPGFISAQFPRIQELFVYKPLPTKSSRARGTLVGFDERYIPEETLDAFYGSVANILEEYSFSPFCELWGDTDELARYVITFRRAPFDREDWDALETHVVPDAEIVTVDLGRIDQEQVNFVSVLPRLFKASQTDLLRLFLPHTFRMDWSRIKDKGLRSLILTTPYLNRYGDDIEVVQIPTYDELVGDEAVTIPVEKGRRVALTKSEKEVQKFKQGTGTLAKLSDKWCQIVWDWFSEFHRYWSGSITFKGRPNIKVGQRLELPSETAKHFPQPMVFYVKAVSHNYNVHEGRYLTSAQLVRGQGKDQFILPSTNGRVDILQAVKEKMAREIKNSEPSLTLDIFFKGRRF